MSLVGKSGLCLHILCVVLFCCDLGHVYDINLSVLGDMQVRSVFLHLPLGGTI